MPVAKDAKGTRKLKQRQRQTNRRRLLKKKEPLQLRQFTQITKREKLKIEDRKRRRGEYEIDSKENLSDDRPKKKQRIIGETTDDNENKKFGFGGELTGDEKFIKSFMDDMNDAIPKDIDENILEDENNDKFDDSQADISDDNDSYITNERPSRKKLELENKQLKREILEHQRGLKELKEQDPEFFNYLKANDESLLNFDEDFNLDEIDNVDEYVKKKRKSKYNKDVALFTEEDTKQNDESSNNNNNNFDDENENDIEMKDENDKLIDETLDSLSDELENEEDSDEMYGFELSSESLKNTISELETKHSVASLREMMNNFSQFVQQFIQNQISSGDTNNKSV